MKRSTILLVITDGDVRVRPDYLRAMVSPFRDPKVGSATCLYTSTKEVTFLQELQSVSMTSDFFAGIMTAWKLDGVKFTFGQIDRHDAQEYRRLRRL